eukprot:COSAG05_NODE_21980_length_268_cov_0.603550_1_plen_48_part_01
MYYYNACIPIVEADKLRRHGRGVQIWSTCEAILLELRGSYVYSVRTRS